MVETRSKPIPHAENLPGPAEARSLTERLIETGLLTNQQLQQAIDVQQRTNAFLAQVIVDLGFVPANVIGHLLSRDLNVPYIDLMAEPPEPEAVKLVSEELVRSARAI